MPTQGISRNAKYTGTETRAREPRSGFALKDAYMGLFAAERWGKGRGELRPENRDAFVPSGLGQDAVFFHVVFITM